MPWKISVWEKNKADSVDSEGNKREENKKINEGANYMEEKRAKREGNKGRETRKIKDCKAKCMEEIK